VNWVRVPGVVPHSGGAQKDGEIGSLARKRMPLKIPAGQIYMERRFRHPSVSDMARVPCKIRPKQLVLPWPILWTQLVTFFGWRLDKMRVEPLHQLFAHGSIVKSSLWKVKDDKERKTGI
jgi:hypothetical protein